MPRCVAWICALLLLASCSGPRVQYDFDPWFDFTSLQAYAWETPKEGAGDEITQRRWRQAIEAELQAKGYRPVHDAPDFVVSLQSVSRVVPGGSVGVGASVGVPFGSHGFLSLGGSGSQPVPRVETAVTLDILSAFSGHKIWTGNTALTVASPGPSDEQDRQVRGRVRELLEGFPPGR